MSYSLDIEFVRGNVFGIQQEIVLGALEYALQNQSIPERRDDTFFLHTVLTSNQWEAAFQQENAASGKIGDVFWSANLTSKGTGSLYFTWKSKTLTTELHQTSHLSSQDKLMIESMLQNVKDMTLNEAETYLKSHKTFFVHRGGTHLAIHLKDGDYRKIALITE